MADQIQLAELLSHISNQLLEADSVSRAAGNATMRFDACELEFAVNIEKSGSAGIKVWIMKLGGDVKKSDSNTIRVKFVSLENRPIQAVHITENAGPEIKRDSRKVAKKSVPRK